MDGPRRRKEEEVQYVVLSHACADMYEEMVKLFSAWPDIVVVVDRQKSKRDPQRLPHPNVAPMRRGAAGNA